MRFKTPFQVLSILYDLCFMIGFLSALFYAISNAEGTVMQVYDQAKPNYAKEMYKFVKQEIGEKDFRQLSALGWLKKNGEKVIDGVGEGYDIVKDFTEGSYDEAVEGIMEEFDDQVDFVINAAKDEAVDYALNFIDDNKAMINKRVNSQAIRRIDEEMDNSKPYLDLYFAACLLYTAKIMGMCFIFNLKGNLGLTDKILALIVRSILIFSIFLCLPLAERLKEFKAFRSYFDYFLITEFFILFVILLLPLDKKN